MRKFFSFFLTLLTITVLIAGCTSAPVVEASCDTSEEVDFTFSMKDHTISPDTWELEAGQTVKIRVINTQGNHDFLLDEMNINTGEIKAGDCVVVEGTVPADAAGKTFEYYCSVGIHRQLGMVGKLTVK